MTPQQAKELLPIITAFASGRKIQCRNISNTGWLDMEDDAVFCLSPNQYRIKPDPIVIKYRRFLFKFSDNSLAIGITNHDINSNSYIENRDDFVRWIDTDWVTYECEV